MSQTVAALMPAAVDYERTLVLAIEVSNKSWVLAAQVPGLPHTKAKRIGLTNRIGAILATLGVSDYNPLLRNRIRRLAELRTALGEPLPRNAHAKIKRLLVRLESVLTQIAEFGA
jgi:hypothetical protein